MKSLPLAAALSLLAAPLVAEPSCIGADHAAPIWEAIKSFEEAGGTVVSFKINDGNCYEIYGSVDGTNMEVFFDPATGAEIGRIDQ